MVFTVPERYAGSLKVGQSVSFRVAALPGETFTAQVDFVDATVPLPARTLVVKALTAHPGAKLAPGMFIEARLATEARVAATIVPEESISPSARGAAAWVSEAGVAVRRDVTLGVRTPGFVEILTGVSPGELVVVGGIERLYPGATLAPQLVERRPAVVQEG